MPFVILIGLNGFFNKNGMTLRVYLKRKIKIIFGKPLVLKSEDVRAYKIKDMEQKILLEKQQKKQGGKNGTKIQAI